MQYDPFSEIVRRVEEATSQSKKSSPFGSVFPFYAVKTKTNSLPYNIIRSETGFIVEMAVAGFDMKDINVVSSTNWVVISGSNGGPEHAKDTVIHKGIAFRDFEQEFKTIDVIKQVRASIKNGLLTVYIDVVNPATENVHHIKINQE